MAHINHLARFLALAILLSTSFLLSAPASTMAAGTAEEAIREAVALHGGTAVDQVVVELIAVDGAWAYGTGTIPAGAGHDSPDVYVALAHDSGSGWGAEIRFTPGFNELLAQAPASFPSPAIRGTLDGFQTAGDGDSDLGFPWAVGESWRFNGPHANSGSRNWAAVDFYPASSAANAPVLAMRGGVVYRPCANTVMIDHGDGWSSYYYHVANISVAQGQSVSRGQQIGVTSAQVGCGGWASGPHVHVYLRYENREVDIDGVDIGGWTVEKGSAEYGGCLTRGTQKHCAEWMSSVPNDGTTGSWSGGGGGGTPQGQSGVSLSPTRAIVNSVIAYNISGFPANSTVSITWRRLTGSSIDMGTAQTNSAGAATGSFRVPATPGGPNQEITFKSGSVSKTAYFEVAPRIKVNTSPGIRGLQVDVSLRGYARQESVRIRWRQPDGAWIDVGQVTTSNTGSANIWITVPLWAPDGNNSVRGDGPEFRQQTNAVYIDGGTFRPAGTAELDPTPSPSATATATVTPGPDSIDNSALPAGDPLPIAQVTDDTSGQSIFTVSDQDPTTAWHLDAMQGFARLTVDLGQPVTMSSVAWLQMQSGCGTIQRVEASLDGRIWSRLSPAAWNGTTQPGVWSALPASGDAQFVRWMVTATPRDAGLGCLAEVAIWGTPVAAPEPAEPTATEPTATEQVEPEATAPVETPETPAPVETATAEPAPTEAPIEIPTEVVPDPTETVTETAPAAEPEDSSDGA